MKLNVLKTEVIALALAATAFGAIAANAQTTVIEEKRDPSVTIQTETPATSTTVKERGGLLGTEKKTTTTTTGAGVSGDCTNKTVHKEGLTGDKTVSKTNCD
jgi:hypothetical protein